MHEDEASNDFAHIEELLGEELEAIQCGLCYCEREEVMQLTSTDGFCSM